MALGTATPTQFHHGVMHGLVAGLGLLRPLVLLHVHYDTRLRASVQVLSFCLPWWVKKEYTTAGGRGLGYSLSKVNEIYPVILSIHHEIPLMGVIDVMMPRHISVQRLDKGNSLATLIMIFV